MSLGLSLLGGHDGLPGLLLGLATGHGLLAGGVHIVKLQITRGSLVSWRDLSLKTENFIVIFIKPARNKILYSKMLSMVIPVIFRSTIKGLKTVCWSRSVSRIAVGDVIGVYQLRQGLPQSAASSGIVGAASVVFGAGDRSCLRVTLS